MYLLKRAFHADFSLIKAWKGDTARYLVSRKTARNFNPIMAAAALITIAEVEEIVEAGSLEPDSVVTSGIYVDRRIQGPTTRNVLNGESRAS